MNDANEKRCLASQIMVELFEAKESGQLQILLTQATSALEQLRREPKSSCLICGHIKPFGVWNAEHPETGVCIECRDRAKLSSHWEYIRKMKDEWTNADWSDFYHAIDDALLKIAARHAAPKSY